MKYYRDDDNNYLGGWDTNPPTGSIEVPFPPGHARQKWNGADNWLDLVPTNEEIDREEIRNDAAIEALLTKRPNEINSHIGAMNSVPELREAVIQLVKQVKLLSGK